MGLLYLLLQGRVTCFSGNLIFALFWQRWAENSPVGSKVPSMSPQATPSYCCKTRQSAKMSKINSELLTNSVQKVGTSSKNEAVFD